MEPAGGGIGENRQIGRQRRPASVKIKRFCMGWVIKDDNDEQSGTPLETGDVPFC